jgi:hypothetical protein
VHVRTAALDLHVVGEIAECDEVIPFARVEHDPNRDPAVISFAKRVNDHEYDREA